MTSPLISLVPALSARPLLSQPFLADLAQSAANAPVFGTDGPEIRDLALRALRREISEGEVADRVWKNHAIRFGNSVPGCDVKVVGDAVEFHAVEQEFAVFDPIDIPYILTWIDEAFQGSLNLIEKNKGEVIMRIRPLSVFEAGARRAFGEDAANWYYVNGEISRGAANREHAKRRQQIALPQIPTFLEQAGFDVPEFVYAIHDLNHAVDVAGIHPELLAIATALHDSISGLPQEFQETEFVPMQLHDLSELLRVKELTLPNFLKRVFLPWEQELRQLQFRLVPGLERRRIVDLCRRYLDLVFSEWIPRLKEERRSSIESYRTNLEAAVRQHL